MKLVQRTLALAVTTVMMAAPMALMAQGHGGPPPGGGQGQGQGGPGMREGRGGNSAMMIVRMSTVQQELRLTQEQIAAINALQPPRGPGGGGNGGPGGGPGGPGQGPLDDILNDNQMNRLKQLSLQFDAPMSLLDRRNAQALQLSETQRQQIDEIIKREMPRPERGQEPPSFDAMQAAKARAFRAAFAVLSNGQKEQWGQMTGRVFTNWVEVPRPPR